MVFTNLRLKQLRKNSRITQLEMAQYLQIGVRQYQYYEKAETDIPSSKLIALADYFNVSIDYLVGRSEDPTRH